MYVSWTCEKFYRSVIAMAVVFSLSLSNVAPAQDQTGATPSTASTFESPSRIPFTYWKIFTSDEVPDEIVLIYLALPVIAAIAKGLWPVYGMSTIPKTIQTIRELRNTPDGRAEVKRLEAMAEKLLNEIKTERANVDKALANNTKQLERITKLLEGTEVSKEGDHGNDEIAKIKRKGLLGLMKPYVTQDEYENLEEAVEDWKLRNIEPLDKWITEFEAGKKELTNDRFRNSTKYKTWKSLYDNARTAEFVTSRSVRAAMRPVAEKLQPYVEAAQKDVTIHPLDTRSEKHSPGRTDYNSQSVRSTEAARLLFNSCQSSYEKVNEQLAAAKAKVSKEALREKRYRVATDATVIATSLALTGRFLFSLGRAVWKNPDGNILARTEMGLNEQQRTAEISKASEISSNSSLGTQLIVQRKSYQPLLDIWSKMLRENRKEIAAVVVGSDTNLDFDVTAKNRILNNPSSLDETIVKAMLMAIKGDKSFEGMGMQEVRAFLATAPTHEKGKDDYEAFVKSLYLETLNSLYPKLSEEKPGVFNEIVNRLATETMVESESVKLALPETYAPHVKIPVRVELKPIIEPKIPDAVKVKAAEPPKTTQDDKKPAATDNKVGTSDEGKPSLPDIDLNKVQTSIQDVFDGNHRIMELINFVAATVLEKAKSSPATSSVVVDTPRPAIPTMMQMP